MRNTINIDEWTPRDVVSMEEWCTSCGVQKEEALQLTFSDPNDARDIQVMTNQDLPAGQTVMFVPSSMVLRGNYVRQELGAATASEELLARRLGQTSETISQFYLFLKILREYEFGDQSPWFPWLNSLPRYFSNGASMTHFCCTQCLPPLVGSLANQERIRFIQFFRALQDVQFLTTETRSNRPLAKWAFAIVSTRSFPSQDGTDYNIVPMADMFNHGTNTEIQISYDEEGNCYAVTNYDVPAGSPLRMSYGDPTNPSKLFARYGFLDETAPATFCKIMITNPSQEIKDMGYDQSRMLFYKDTGEVSPEVWDVLLYQVLESNPSDQQVLYQAHMNGDFETKQALHGQYFLQTKVALQNHVDSFLNSLQTLSKKAEGRNLEIHPRLPLIMRHNEFVRNTFLLVKANLDQM
ncbi:M protein repeat protein [Seminavis robusta]|uniref:M protein repeat protein n=1 Tax=Seminavis robusta TaxID=568900 RepID=A0A9N8D9U4_9STRA|nr:M protein repeat protein [Seminavis robusta]|eukprot:Sro56_g032890.1 M protein repeat protein (409) ;mRNA; f:98444-99782